MEFKDFKQYYIIPELPEIVFKGLTQVDTIKLWTGADAEMSLEKDGAFSLWDEGIVGHNIEIIDGEKLVQQWYFGDYDEDRPSIVSMTLFPHKKGTSLHLVHTNIPDDAFENMVQGWNEVYFSSVIDFYKN